MGAFRFAPHPIRGGLRRVGEKRGKANVEIEGGRKKERGSRKEKADNGMGKTSTREITISTFLGGMGEREEECVKGQQS